MTPRQALNVFLAPALALALQACPAGAARASEPPASLEVAHPNAALRYWAAWAITAPEALEKAGAIDWAPIAKELNASKMSKEYQEAVSVDCDNAVKYLLVAAATDRCDFEARYDEGPEFLLPHLSKMRASARLLRMDARKQLLAGDADAAVERLVAIERMAGHLASDRTIISSLVGIAIASVGFTEAETLLASGRLTDARRASLLAALRALDTDDPIGIRAALAFEKVTMSNWVRRSYTGPTAGRDLAEYFTTSMPGESTEVHAAALAVLDEAGLNAEVDRMGGAFDDTIAAWSQPDVKVRLVEIETRIGAGEYGQLGAVLAPAVSRVRAASERFQTDVKAAIAKLAATGPAGSAPAPAPASNKSGGR